MGSLLDQPAAVLVMISLAALLLVAEAALPTVGIAGTLSLLLSVGVVVGLRRQDATWWPLLGPALAVGVWCVMVARRSRSPVGQVTAAVLFLSGSVAFGAMADSPVTVVAGGLAATALAAVYPRLNRAALHLLEGPTQVGMDSMVGARAEVVAWTGQAGTVRVAGSLWGATSAQPVAVGDTVAVTSFAGMTLEVALMSDLNG